MKPNDHLADASKGSAFGKWQTIETAPKDGTHLLATDGAIMTTVHWYEPPTWPGIPQGRGWWDLVVCGAYAEDGEWHPSHWMPLPPPPAASPEGTAE